MAICTASVAHQIPIQTKIASALWASIGNPSGFGNIRIRIAAISPIRKPDFDFELSFMKMCPDKTLHRILEVIFELSKKFNKAVCRN